jgi:hypothetical protein
MVQRVSILNSNDTLLVNDYDLSQLEKWLTSETWGVLFSNLTSKPEFDINQTTGVVAAGEAVIKVTRTASQPIANEEFYIRFESSESETLAVTNGNKIYIEISNTLLQDPTLIEDTPPSTDYALGKSIWVIKSTASYPAHTNYLKLWEISGGGVFTDMRVYPRVLGDKVDMSNMTQNIVTQGNVTANDVYTSTWSVQSQINALSWWAQVTQVTLWENVTAWDWDWAFFYWKWLQNTLEKTNVRPWSNLNCGDWTTVKSWMTFTVPASWNYSDTIRNIKLWIKKTGAPADNLQFNLYQSDKTTAVWTFSQQVIAWWSLTTSYVEQEIDLQDVQLTEGSVYFLEFSRSWGQDAWNYYQFEYWAADDAAWYGLSTYNWAARSDSTSDLHFRMQYWYTFTAWKVRLTDVRYNSTNVCNGVITASWSADDSVNATLSWVLPQTSATVWSIYVLASAWRWKFSTTRTWLTYQPMVIWRWNSATSIQLFTNEQAFIEQDELYVIKAGEDYELYYDSTTYSVTDTLTPVFQTYTIVPISWTYTVTFWMNSDTATPTAKWRIYRNWVAYWTEQTWVNTWTEFKENLYFDKWDSMELYIWRW